MRGPAGDDLARSTTQRVNLGEPHTGGRLSNRGIPTSRCETVCETNENKDSNEELSDNKATVYQNVDEWKNYWRNDGLISTNNKANW